MSIAVAPAIPAARPRPGRHARREQARAPRTRVAALAARVVANQLADVAGRNPALAIALLLRPALHVLSRTATASTAADRHFELGAATIVDPHAVPALAPRAPLDAGRVGLLVHEPRAAVDRQLALAVLALDRRTVELEPVAAAAATAAAAPAEAEQAHVAAPGLDEARAPGHAPGWITRLQVDGPAILVLLVVAGADHHVAAPRRLTLAVRLRRALRRRIGQRRSAAEQPEPRQSRERQSLPVAIHHPTPAANRRPPVPPRPTNPTSGCRA